MYISYAATLSLLFSAATAAVDYSQWKAPGPNDVRAPCPGLNSLANHGFIPRNGKDITIPILIKAFKDAMNVGPDFASIVGTLATLAAPSSPLALSFSLADIRRHNFPIEHDASLSRSDFDLNNGDNFRFNQSIFDTVLAYYSGMESTSIPVAAKAKYNRVNTERRRNPKFTYTAQHFVLAYGETALYLSVLGDPTTGVAPLDYVKVLFQEERLPYNEGWRPTQSETNFGTLGPMIAQLYIAAGEVLPEGLLLTTHTLKLAFGGYNPVTGLLAHIL